MTLAIRAARAGEASLVLTMIRELAEYEKLSDDVVATDAMIDDALFGARPRVFCEIAEWDGAPAGLSLWSYNYSTFTGRRGLYLEDLYVREAFRGKGVGKALLRKLAQRCVDEKLTRLQWSVLDWNEPSIAFYKSLGAYELGDWLQFRVDGPALVDLARGD